MVLAQPQRALYAIGRHRADLRCMSRAGGRVACGAPWPSGKGRLAGTRTADCSPASPCVPGWAMVAPLECGVVQGGCAHSFPMGYPQVLSPLCRLVIAFLDVCNSAPCTKGREDRVALDPRYRSCRDSSPDSDDAAVTGHCVADEGRWSGTAAMPSPPRRLWVRLRQLYFGALL